MEEEKAKKKKIVKRVKIKKEKVDNKIDALEKEKEVTITNKEDIIEVSGTTKGSKSLFNLAEVIVIMIITALFGALIGAAVTYVKNDSNDNQKYTVKNDDNLAEFTNVYNDILSSYYKTVDKAELVDSAIKGMVDYLGDPYSEYFNEEESKIFDEQLDGEFVGMGAEITMNENSKVVVTKIFESSPAEAAGIQLGDIINKVADKDLTGLTIDKVASLIKAGVAGTKVVINIIRDEKPMDIEITRGRVELTTAIGSIININNKKVGIIKIESFAKNTAQQFKVQYDKLKDGGVDSLVIDLRNNFGGYLSVAKEIADYFLEPSDVVYQTDTKGKISKELSNTEKSINLPVVILVNNGSASASEILTAALKENLKIDVVGTKTYGKGTVQKLYKLSDGTSVKYTIQNWLTPNGNLIDKVGIEPTVQVELSDKYYAEPTDENDNQLQKALELITD